MIGLWWGAPNVSEDPSAMLACKEFTVGTHSENIAALRTFQIWQNKAVNGLERVFCEKTLH